MTSRYTYGDIQFTGKGKISVGSFCSFALYVKAITFGHHTKWVSTYPFGSDEFKEHWNTDVPGHPKQWDISIGNDVWIGQDAIIMANIGNGAIVGAGSVVRNDVPPYAIVIGNPAVVVKMRFTANQIADLEEIAWWDWPDEKIKAHVHLLCSPDINEFINVAKGMK